MKEAGNILGGKWRGRNKGESTEILTSHMTTGRAAVTLAPFIYVELGKRLMGRNVLSA
jgi:hypothetical protein